MNTHPIVGFWIIYFVLLFAIIYCDRRYCMLKDTSVASPQPYSWARVQLAWWSLIVLSAFIAVMLKYGIAPTLNESTVILIGISAATIATARVIDINDENNPAVARHQNKQGSNLLIDIISDQGGPSIHRFQTVVFNIAFGVYFIVYVIRNLQAEPGGAADAVMPVIAPNNLVLLGLSSATYAALKFTENKSEEKKLKTEEAVSDADVVNPVNDEPAVG